MTDETNGLLDTDEPLEQIGLLEQIEMLEKEPGQNGHADPADQIERADHRPDGVTQSGSLTERQKAAAYAMVRDGRGLGAIMEESGMTPEEAVAWIRAGRFTAYVSELARAFAEADAPTVWAALLHAAEDGNVPAARLYFDLMERSAGRRGDPVALPASPSEELRSLRESIFGGGA